MLVLAGGISGPARSAPAQTVLPVAQCAAAPLPCVEGSRLKLRLDLRKVRLVWKWAAGNVVDIRDLGNPAIGPGGYDLCVYDAGGALVAALGVPPAGTCSGRPCWRARPYGFQYRDRDASSFGVKKITLKAAFGGHGDRLSLRAGGAALPLPAAAPVAPLTGQLVRTDDPSGCWTGTTR